MSARVIGSLAELRGLVGAEVGTSDWVEIAQERIDAFADATEDHQWIHVDVERATAGPFGAPIAHGFLTLSLLPQFASRIFSIGFGSARLNYGLESVRFPAPVPVGSRLRATASVESVEETAKGVQARIRYVVEIEGRDRPACVATHIVLVVT
ncbi:putative enoyl-CoA hydratase 1 [Nostocoides japonicum T1-X7]|uniref:Putative enoyl-CoA hydratase 1 n=1 Tax=Nostocoides japonicum T1-X7 TaxID=1194083 RepID=A0A077LWI8_9MICO|nr:MaoC family dehydratase [Tetrasphaera japonica]CCH78298.1 putative enoyl-CoA hydratase 1 [Tetrasphaera japonica T1-X7]